MRCAPALIVAAMAAGEAAASNNRHAHFHARRNGASKRNAGDVDWANVAYDFSGVDFNTVNYGNKAKASATPAPAAPSAAAPAVESETAPTSTVKTAAATSAAAAPAKSSDSSDVGDIIGGIVEGIESFAKALDGITAGANAKAYVEGGIWIGSGGDYQITFTNDDDSTAALLCWRKETMWINATPAPIFVTVPGGGKQTISAAEGFSGGCGFAYADSILSMGQLNESILEFTAKSGPGEGCFDVSREINMKGLVMTAAGSICTSGLLDDANICTYVCTNGQDKCGDPNTYGIHVGAADEKCMDGKDGGQAAGGCLMNGKGEHVQVTVKKNREWPSTS